MYYMADRMLTVRVPESELAALDDVARRMAMPRSVLMRAGLVAVVQDPRLVWSTRGVDLASDPEPVAAGPSAPPPPPRKRGKRR
jgi:hypothetical protein